MPLAPLARRVQRVTRVPLAPPAPPAPPARRVRRVTRVPLSPAPPAPLVLPARPVLPAPQVLNGSAASITVAGGTATGDKQFTVSCPAAKHALSGGFNIQGSVTASFRSNANGDPTGNTAWTIIQSSGASLSGTVYVYCA